MYKLNKISTILASLYILSVSSVAAEDEDEAETETESAQIEKIVVTAQKRSQSIQEIPASITAISGAELTDSNNRNLVDIADMIPNVSISSQSSIPQIYIRGIGSGVNYGFEQSIAQFKDGVYQGRAILARSPVYDIERLEVLKGTQSIMFGKNATAGAISTITRSSSDDTDGYINATLGSFGEKTFQGAFNVSLNDDWTARLAGIWSDTDGFMKNAADNNENIGGIDQTGVRFTLNGQVSDNLSLELKVAHDTTELDVTQRQYYIDQDQVDAAAALGVSAGLTNSLVNNGPVDDILYANDSVAGQAPFQDDVKIDTAVLKLDYDIGDNLLTSITSYLEYEWDYAYDPTYSERTFLGLLRTDNYRQFTQEIRLVSPSSDTFDYIVGAFYTNSDMNLTLDVDVVNYPAWPFDSILGQHGSFEQNQESIAAFFSFGYQISDALKIDVGGRYDSETKDVENVQETYRIVPDTTYAYADGLMAAFGSGNNNLKANRKEQHFSPSVKLTYQINTDIMTYASFSQGYKGGGFDGTMLNSSGKKGLSDAEGNPHGHDNPATVAGSSFKYDEEKATSYELGIKSEVLDGQGRINLSVYSTTYEDMQVSVFTGTAFEVDNAAKAVVKGVEADSVFLLTDELTLSLNAAYLDFAYDDYDAGPATKWQSKVLGQESQDMTGRTSLYAPETDCFCRIDT